MAVAPDSGTSAESVTYTAAYTSTVSGTMAITLAIGAAEIGRGALCAGDDDGAGAACALSGDASACAVVGGDCAYR